MTNGQDKVLRDFRLPWTNLFVLAVVACGAYVILMPRGNPTTAQRLACANNLRQIGIAVFGYMQAYRAFPPQFLQDSDGRPNRSWRTLVYSSRPRATRLRPWDDPRYTHWFAALDMPEEFRCPVDEKAGDDLTSYVAVTGPGFLFNGTKPTRQEDITDTLTDTIAVVEFAESNIGWNEPRDVTWDEFAKRYDEKRVGNHKHGFMALFAAGNTRLIHYGMDKKILRAHFTIAGDEDIEALREAQTKRWEEERLRQGAATTR